MTLTSGALKLYRTPTECESLAQAATYCYNAQYKAFLFEGDVYVMNGAGYVKTPFRLVDFTV